MNLAPNDRAEKKWRRNLKAVSDLHKQERFDEAALAAEDLRSKYPDRVRAHRLAADIHLARGSAGPAASALRRVLELEPEDWKARARLARSVSDPAEAYAALEPLLGERTTVPLRIQAAEALLHSGRADEAIDLLRGAITFNPAHRGAREALIAALTTAGRPDAAEAASAELAAMAEKLSPADVVRRVAAADAAASRYVINIGARDGKSWDDPCYELYQEGAPGVCIDAGDFPDLHRNLPQPEVRKLLNTPVTPGNVLELLRGADCPSEPALLKIDIDSFDGDVLRAALTGIRPHVIQIEVNPEIPPPVQFAIHYHPRYRHSGKAGFFGCSVAYVAALSRPYGYEVLEIDLTDPPQCQDMILVRREYLSQFGVTEPVDLHALFHREPVAIGGFHSVGYDSSSWRDHSDPDALLAEVWEACVAASMARSDEVLPFLLAR